jgi:hypothetical protein
MKGFPGFALGAYVLQPNAHTFFRKSLLYAMLPVLLFLVLCFLGHNLRLFQYDATPETRLNFIYMLTRRVFHGHRKVFDITMMSLIWDEAFEVPVSTGARPVRIKAMIADMTRKNLLMISFLIIYCSLHCTQSLRLFLLRVLWFLEFMLFGLASRE